MCEFRINGLSKFLPPGRQLTMLRLPRFIKGSIADRRDFYHQAAVTPERARTNMTNMLPFQYLPESFAGSAALAELEERVLSKTSSRREVIGDQLGKPGPKDLVSCRHRSIHASFLVPR